VYSLKTNQNKNSTCRRNCIYIYRLWSCTPIKSIRM